MDDWEKWKTFNVAGVTFKNDPKDKYTRLEMISHYCSHESNFVLERDPDNEFDKSGNAIKVKQIFKNGGSVQLGFVPNSIKNPLAESLALILDIVGEIDLKFGRKFIDEATGECQGLQLRYKILAL